ncbi:hypothetical protein J31TS6_08240 [Brevibacillus reuszeri]|uniref:alpha/beta hydrolase family protein n=1 Tax=Brevibacillus reuszeri TaxID=54915 RepID=UPI001B2A237C|nr:alpha/beta fold hydrolase [Brevibacillus reuszeri]GIO04796.1 hypothetical protein J31TS6_08240 [Brevibacillus reuszeri]
MNTSIKTQSKRVRRIAYGEHEDQFGDLRLPDGKGPHPVAIVIHGGFWRAKVQLDHMNKLVEAITDLGIATWNIEYRRVGQTGGGWPGTFLDSALAADFVRTLAQTYPLDVDRIFAIGHSAGGHLALWLAGRHKLPQDSVLKNSDKHLRLKGAISLAGVCDLELMHDIHKLREKIMGISENPTFDLIGGTPKELQSRYEQGSPIALLPLGIPLVLIHGALDINVPIGVSEHFEKAAIAAGDQIVFWPLTKAEHFKLIDPMADEWSVVKASIQRLLNQNGADQNGYERIEPIANDHR